MARTNILVVDDEESILELLEMGLEREGYGVLLARDGNEGLSLCQQESPALVVLDWMLPGMEGIDLCRELRTFSQVPILMLTARGQLDDRVLGLDSGADDFMPKPFKIKELLARVRALLRRSGMLQGTRLSFGEICLDLSERKVTVEERPVVLTLREFQILEYLMRHPRQVLTREQILTEVWGWEYPGGGNVLEVHMSALRAKLGESARRLLRTVRGVGYAIGR